MKNCSNLLIICCLFLSVFISESAYSNCEAGGYMIHTKATYKNSDQQVYAILRGEKININSIDDSPGDTSSFRKNLVGDYEVHFKGTGCGKAKIQVNGQDVYDSPQLSIRDLRCNGFKASGGNYIVINKEKKKLLIGEKLNIDRPLKVKDINPQIKNIIHNNNFPGSSGNTIDQADILNLKSFPVYSTKLGDSFSVLIAELYIKNVAKYFKDDGYAYYGKQYMKFENTKVGYPVLMFSSKGKVEYVGDGSHCSAVPVMYRNMELVKWKEKMRDPTYKATKGETTSLEKFHKDQNGLFYLGLLDRFKVTNAFDMDGDGQVDIIEINNRFAYRILDGFKFEVINMGTGC